MKKDFNDILLKLEKTMDVENHVGLDYATKYIRRNNLYIFSRKLQSNINHSSCKTVAT